MILNVNSDQQGHSSSNYSQKSGAGSDHSRPAKGVNGDDTDKNSREEANLGQAECKPSRGSAYNNADRPEDTRFDDRINTEIAVAIISSRDYHHKLEQALSSWWNTTRFPNLVTVVSDTYDGQVIVEDFGANVRRLTVPNVWDSGCSSSYNRGLWCKNGAIIKKWQTDPQYKDVKWFARVMDDSYLHLENMLHLFDQYDHTQPYVFAEHWCKTLGSIDYPTGGPGILFSRGVLDSWNWRAWNLANDLPEAEILDDVLWGEYLAHPNVSIPITNHFGMSQFSWRSDSSVLLYYMSFSYGLDRLWPMDFRPVALHQHKSDISMATLHKRLHNIAYEPVAPKIYKTRPCFCTGDQHGKCIWDYELKERCRWSTDLLRCVAKGPFE